MLSAVRDVFELTLARWEKKEHWSPWNCLLLTKDEAKAHSKLEDIQQVGTCTLCDGHVHSKPLVAEFEKPLMREFSLIYNTCAVFSLAYLRGIG